MKIKALKHFKWLLLTGCFLTPAAFALCPLCTIAVGAGIGFFEWMGISDLITGLWVGALMVSLSFWTANWFNRKGWRFPMLGLIMFAIYAVLIVLPLYYPLGYIGRPNHTLWHIDILLLGIIIGAVVFFCASIFHLYLKVRNEGRVYFPLQKVVIPVLPLVLLSIIFYFIV
jgi:MFS family permease